jgi:SAM-dependent methyltransferase
LEKRIAYTFFNKGKVLNVGCGKLKIKNAVNLDNNPKVNPDILWDLNNLPLPFKDQEFYNAINFDIIEHVPNPEKLVKEIERVSKNSVWFCLNFDKAKKNWFADNTHISYINLKRWKEIFPKEKYITIPIGDCLIAISKKQKSLLTKLILIFQMFFSLS